MITDVVKLWEELRRHDTKPARRLELVSLILGQIKGRVATLASSHASSRVVQACVKHGSDRDRRIVAAEVKPAFCELAKNAYARFAVQKLVAIADKKGIQGTAGSMGRGRGTRTWGTDMGCCGAWGVVGRGV